MRTHFNIVFWIYCLILLNQYSISAQEKSTMQELLLLDKNDFNPYVEFISADVNDFFNPEQSSEYPSVNVFDGYFKTCWVAGSSRTNNSFALNVKLPPHIEIDQVILNIFGGYGKNRTLYYKNARPKTVKLSIFAAFFSENYSTEVANLYLVKKYPEDIYIALADTFGVQSFPLHLDKKALLHFQRKSYRECRSFSGEKYNRFFADAALDSLTSGFIGQLTIGGVYNGSTYDDICISEIFFNDRFITASPDTDNQINDVYITEDSIVFADYADKRSVAVYQDSLSVFTMIDWPKHANWAILHYVPNDAEGAGSRIEELYSIIDLKNRNIVNDQFERCTGVSPMFQVLTKDEHGNTVTNIFGDYSIELK